VRRLGVVLAALALAGCSGTDEQAATTAQQRQPQPDPAPLFYPVAKGSVRAWLEQVKPLKGLGRWHNAVLSPDGKTLLAQWTAECEIPVAFFVPVDTRTPRPVAPTHYETVVVGWNDDGRAGVFFNGGACGGAPERPGLYLVSLDGKREFVTDDVDAVERWKAERS
jgi:hypothetical protein